MIRTAACIYERERGPGRVGLICMAYSPTLVPAVLANVAVLPASVLPGVGVVRVAWVGVIQCAVYP